VLDVEPVGAADAGTLLRREKSLLRGCGEVLELASKVALLLSIIRPRTVFSASS
jgi:hypothetical protein